MSVSLARSRVLPATGRLDVDQTFRTSKVVDHPNISRRFGSSRATTPITGRHTASNFSLGHHSNNNNNSNNNYNNGGCASVVYKEGDGSRPRGISTARTPRNANVFEAEPDAKIHAVRQTGMMNYQMERARRAEDNPRALRRSYNHVRPEPNFNMMYTSKGIATNGGKGKHNPGPTDNFHSTDGMSMNTTGKDFAAESCSRAAAMQRFQNTRRPSTHVLTPEQLADERHPVSQARFRNTPVGKQSLHGVLYPLAERQPREYRPRAPFFTDE